MSTEDRISKLESKIEAIEKRNNKVEGDKAWEKSWTRRLLIILFTYLAIALYLYFIVGIDPWINAVVPALGFILTTLALPFIKNFWIKHLHRKVN